MTSHLLLKGRGYIKLFAAYCIVLFLSNYPFLSDAYELMMRLFFSKLLRLFNLKDRFRSVFPTHEYIFVFLALVIFSQLLRFISIFVGW